MWCRKLSPVANFKFLNDFAKSEPDFVASKTLGVQHTHNSCKYLITGYLLNNTIQYNVGENFLKLNSYCVCVAIVKSLRKLSAPSNPLKLLKTGFNLILLLKNLTLMPNPCYYKITKGAS